MDGSKLLFTEVSEPRLSRAEEPGERLRTQEWVRSDERQTDAPSTPTQGPAHSLQRSFLGTGSDLQAAVWEAAWRGPNRLIRGDSPRTHLGVRDLSPPSPPLSPLKPAEQATSTGRLLSLLPDDAQGTACQSLRIQSSSTQQVFTEYLLLFRH